MYHKDYALSRAFFMLIKSCLPIVHVVMFFKFSVELKY